jgi:hypothetical protein
MRRRRQLVGGNRGKRDDVHDGIDDSHHDGRNDVDHRSDHDDDGIDDGHHDGRNDVDHRSDDGQRWCRRRDVDDNGRWR